MTSKRPVAAEPRSLLASAWYGATLRGLDFSHAELVSVSGPRTLWLDRCKFVEADLRHATLDHWHFKLCDLTSANLRGASLRGASFSGCDLTGADLRDTDLTGVRLGSVGVGKGAFETRIDGALFDPHVDPARLWRPRGGE